MSVHNGKLLGLHAEYVSACAAEDGKQADATLQKLKWEVLLHGIPSDNDSETRPLVWKTFLGMSQSSVDADTYRALVAERKVGDDKSYTLIRGDSYRSFQTSEVFTAKVTQAMLSRVCNALQHKYPKFSYVQGVAQMAGVMMYAMSEVEAFFMLSSFLSRHCPTYWVSGYAGAQAGCVLVNRVIEYCDKELYEHMAREMETITGTSSQWGMILYHPVVSSLGSSVEPFDEYVQLFDCLVCLGMQYNVVAVAAQVMAMRAQLLQKDGMGIKKMLDYRTGWPPLRARFLLSLTCNLLRILPKELKADIDRHAVDADFVEAVVGKKVEVGKLKSISDSLEQP
jgi:hypothetical protein